MSDSKSIRFDILTLILDILAPNLEDTNEMIVGGTAHLDILTLHLDILKIISIF